jgi:hypothetical protein
MPTPGATNTPDSTQDQIYSVLAQGNTAKLGQPLPVWYGCLKAFGSVWLAFGRGIHGVDHECHCPIATRSATNAFSVSCSIRRV